MDNFLKRFLPISLSVVIISTAGFLWLNTPKAQAGFSYSRTITIDHTKVPNTNQTNFPVLVNGTYSYLATVANGGNIQNTISFNGQTVPADLKFTSDSAGTTLLSWEVASYTSTTGAIEVWVNVPTVATATDTVIYMFYGDSSVLTYQGGAVGAVYDSNYKGVWHLPNGTTLTANDSTTNANNGSVNGLITATTGQIDGAMATPGSGAASVQASDSASLTVTGSLTYEAWVYPTNTGIYQSIISKVDSGNGNREYSLFLDAGSQSNVYIGLNRSTVSPYLSYNNTVGMSSSWSTNAWNHIVVAVNAGTDFRVYLNGALAATISGNYGSTDSGNVAPIFFGEEFNNSFPMVSGKIDEVRVSNTNRSADWIATEYNNQNSPSTFYTLGSQQSVTSPSSQVTVGKYGSVQVIGNGAMVIRAR